MVILPSRAILSYLVNKYAEENPSKRSNSSYDDDDDDYDGYDDDGDNDDDDDDADNHEENADDKCFKVYTQPTQSKEPQWIACYTLTMGRSTRTLSTTL